MLRKSVGCKKMSHIFFKIRNSYGNYIKQKFSKGLQRRIFKTKLKKLAVSLCKFCGKVLINRNNIKKRYLSSIKVKTMLKFLRRFYLGLLL